MGHHLMMSPEPFTPLKIPIRRSGDCLNRVPLGPYGRSDGGEADTFPLMAGNVRNGAPSDDVRAQGRGGQVVPEGPRCRRRSYHQQPEVNYSPRFSPLLICLELRGDRSREIDLFENLDIVHIRLLVVGGGPAGTLIAHRKCPYSFLGGGRGLRESSLLTTYWSGSSDVFGGPASRHGSLNSLFQVALYLPS